MSFFRQFFILLRKEIRLESRDRKHLSMIFFFSVLAIGVFGISIQVGPDIQREIAAGVMWVILSFSAVLSMGQLYFRDLEEGVLDILRMSPLSREVIFFSKVAVIFLSLFLSALWFVPLSAVMFQVSLEKLLSFSLFLIFFLGILGISILGVLISTINLKARGGNSLLFLLFLPIVLPLLIASARATGEILTGGVTHTGLWLRGLAVYDIVFLILSLWLFEVQFEQL